MGLFHCVESSCAEVRFQKYQKVGGISFSFEFEEPTIVDGDSYDIKDNRLGQCTIDTLYVIEFDAYSYGFGDYPGASGIGGVYRHRIQLPEFQRVVNPDDPFTFEYSPVQGYPDYPAEIATKVYASSQAEDGTVQQSYTLSETNYGINPSTITNVEIIKNHYVRRGVFYPVSPETDNCGGCTLEIYKDDQIIYGETRSSCPEVEVIEGDCKLSDRTHVIKIEKLAIFERIEIRDQSINPIYVSPLNAPLLDVNPLPEGCYNIYKTAIAAPPLLSNFVPLPGLVNPFEFIAQICSDQDCPAPKYEVICNCEGEECPPGTCPHECGGVVCCYDTSTGKSIVEISLENYIGGDL